jgi:hypothetical protein
MRRREMSRAIGLVVAAGVLLVTAGCAQLPPGADGDLGNGWPAVAAPVGWVPEAGTCHRTFAVYVTRTGYEPVACNLGHAYETVHVGTFTGAAAERSSPPVAGSTELAAAWAECDKKISEYVGGEWRTGKLWIGVTVPSGGAWGGDARWFRCEVAALGKFGGDEVTRQQSLKGALAAEPALKLGCYQYDGTAKTSAEKPCTEAHNAEFVGIYTLDVNYAQASDLDEQIGNACWGLAATFAGMPGDKDIKYRTGVMWDFPGKADWEAGDHGVRCHLWLSKKTVTRSLAGAGNGGLPINYA